MESLETVVQSEAPATGPLDEQSIRLVASLEALFHRMMLSPQAVDRPSFEVTKEEVRAMIVLSMHSEITMSDLAEALAVPLSTATHTVDKLVAKELAVRSRSEQDRRLVLVTMSQNGRKFQEMLRARHTATARSWLGPLSPGEREIFLELMAKITRLAQL